MSDPKEGGDSPKRKTIKFANDSSFDTIHNDSQENIDLNKKKRQSMRKSMVNR